MTKKRIGTATIVDGKIVTYAELDKLQKAKAKQEPKAKAKQEPKVKI